MGKVDDEYATVGGGTYPTRVPWYLLSRIAVHRATLRVVRVPSRNAAWGTRGYRFGQVEWEFHMAVVYQ